MVERTVTKLRRELTAACSFLVHGRGQSQALQETYRGRMRVNSHNSEHRKSQPGRKSSCKVKACVKPLSLEIYRSELGCMSLLYLGPFCTGVWTTQPPATSTQYPSDPGSHCPVAKTANNWWNTFFVIEDRFQPPHLKYSADRSSFQLCGSFQQPSS